MNSRLGGNKASKDSKVTLSLAPSSDEVFEGGDEKSTGEKRRSARDGDEDFSTGGGLSREIPKPRTSPEKGEGEGLDGGGVSNKEKESEGEGVGDVSAAKERREPWKGSMV